MTCEGQALDVDDVWGDGIGHPGFRCQCGWEIDAGDVAYRCWAVLEVDDGRIRSADDVAPRIEGTRARARADELLSGPLLALLELYCDEALTRGWVEITASDHWARDRLAERLAPRNVHTTQVRRHRLALERLGYLRRNLEPFRQANIRLAEEYRRHGKRPPLFVEVLKSPKQEIT
jgi:hypothetical protein